MRFVFRLSAPEPGLRQRRSGERSSSSLRPLAWTGDNPIKTGYFDAHRSLHNLQSQAISTSPNGREARARGRGERTEMETMKRREA
ncbi:uncharacterized [Tachysurus ichikawai]